MTLYHGTRHKFEPGDLILPRSKKVAHATPSLMTASVFAEDGHVYEVEPLNEDTTWARLMKYTDGEVHREVLSEEGFRVIREVEAVPTIVEGEDTRTCEECGRITDAGDWPDWINGVCEVCDPSILNLPPECRTFGYIQDGECQGHSHEDGA